MRRLAMGSLAVAWVAMLSSAAWCAPTTKPPSTTPAPKVTNYIVVEIKNTTGDIAYEGIAFPTLKERIKRAHDEFVTAEKAWDKAKADAAKAGTKFDKPKPVEGYVHRIGEDTVYKTQAEATEAANKLKEAYEKKKAEEKAKAGG